MIVPVVSVVILLLLLAVPISASAEPELAPNAAGCSAWYIVKPGDTLAKIAARYGTTASQLAWLNGIPNPNFIRSGQTLCVKGGTPPPPPPPPPPPKCGYWYTIKWGDTLVKIGNSTGWSAWYLANVNGITNPDRIWSGHTLWIPCHS